MTILFIVTSFWAFGELLITIEFARQIHSQKIKILFLVPRSHLSITKKSGFESIQLLHGCHKVNKIILKDIQNKYNPELIILSDFLNYTFCEKYYGLSAIDLGIFNGKIGTFDNFDWEITGNQMDTYGFKAKIVKLVNIDDYHFRLCPCPVVSPYQRNAPGRYPYRLIARNLKPVPSDFYRKKFNLPIDKKIILFTSATWQETYRSYPNIKEFVDEANFAMRILIDRLIKRGHCVVYIGPVGLFTNEDRREGFRIFNQLPPDQFDQLLIGADIFLSRNLISTTLARVTVSGTPSVLIQNSLFKRKSGKSNFENANWLASTWRRRLDRLSHCYPFRMFPVGWFHFLTPLFENNSFFDCLKTVEQFDIDGSIETIEDILYSTQTKKIYSGRLEKYTQHLNTLPTVNDIIKKITGNSKINQNILGLSVPQRTFETELIIK